MVLVGFPPVSDEDLVRLGELNPGWSFERDDDGATIVSPTNTQGGARSGEALFQLAAWARAGPGGVVYDSSTGFTMSTGAVRCPDAAWLSRERIDALPAEAKTGFWRACPDVVVEVASEWDAWTDLVAKIDMYDREGARYAIAIDPLRRRIYERGEAPPGLRFDVNAIAAAGS